MSETIERLSEILESLQEQIQKTVSITLRPGEETAEPKFVIVCRFVAPTGLGLRNKLQHEIEKALRNQGNVRSVIRNKITKEWTYTFVMSR